MRSQPIHPAPSASDKAEEKKPKTDEKPVVNRARMFSKLLTFGAKVGFETAKVIANPDLRMPFFTGKPILSGVPHLPGNLFLGHINFSADLTNKLTAHALKTPLGIATYWAAPFIPAVYVVTNPSRSALVQESHIGSVCNQSEKYLRWLSAENQVMTNFLAFININSKRYIDQRKFLLKFFHGGARHRLPMLDDATKGFLQNYTKEHSERPRSLREFITLLVLHTSSQLLGLTQCGLDVLYAQNPLYHQAIEEVAHYGIGKKGNPKFEKILFNLFLEAFKNNFEDLSFSNPETNFIQCIFSSMNLSFPGSFYDFCQLPQETQHVIAMTFAAVAIAGLIHSTVNSLDWALARLLKNKDKLNALTSLMTENRDIDMTEEHVFDKKGPLFKLAEWVLHNVFLYPTFSHEFFYNSKPLPVTFSNGVAHTLPKGLLIVVNYKECNAQESKMVNLESFSSHLSDDATTARFMMNPKVASFGGSKVSRENKQSRICPGAKTSLYEQMIIIGEILKSGYSLEAKEISDEIDRSKHPLCSRVNRGDVTFHPTTPPKSKESKEHWTGTFFDADRDVRNKQSMKDIVIQRSLVRSTLS